MQCPRAGCFPTTTPNEIMTVSHRSLSTLQRTLAGATLALGPRQQLVRAPLRGGVVLAAGGAIAAREWAARVGTAKMFALLAVYLLGFGASHPLAKKIGAWPAVFTAAGASAVAAHVVSDSAA